MNPALPTMTATLQTGMWVAVFSHAGRERSVQQGLAERGYETFLPTYAVRSERGARRLSTRVLFPGYVFCRYLEHAVHRIVSVPNVLRLVGTTRNAEPIPDEEIDSIRRIIGSGVYSEPWFYVTAGTRVVITNGALRGLEGIFVNAASASRVIVSVTLLQRSVAVEVHATDVAPVKHADVREAALMSLASSVPSPAPLAFARPC